MMREELIIRVFLREGFDKFLRNRFAVTQLQLNGRQRQSPWRCCCRGALLARSPRRSVRVGASM